MEEESQRDGYTPKNRHHKTEYHRTTQPTVEVESRHDKSPYIEDNYKKLHDEIQEDGNKRYDRDRGNQVLNGSKP